jgi:hypothetical protein
LLIACAALLSAQTDAPQSSRDPVFADIPFDKWLTGADQSHIRWSTQISDPQLSSHQRIAARVFAQVDGNELAKRRGKGKLLVLVQIDDGHGHVWQNHQEMDLEHVEEGIKANDAVFSQQFFVLPGDYRLITALYDTATSEHTISRRRLHVTPLKNDPLPEAWRDLPPIEFIAPSRPPDSWYLPAIETRLNLNATPHEPVRVNLIVNLTPSERLTGSSRVQNRNFGSLLPATKILSQVDWSNSPFRLELLDLSRLKVTYEQERAGPLDWSTASASLSEVNPGLIDIKSLENRQHSAQFFLDRVDKGLEQKPTQTVLIILSSAVEFGSGQEMRPVIPEVAGNAKLFYIRYISPYLVNQGGGRGRRGNGFPPVAANMAPFDQLAGLLKPLDPHLYEVASPEQFRKALAVILAEISKL